MTIRMTGLTDLFTEIRADLIDKYNINLQGNAPLVFLFNPSHEMALADNSDNYTPTAVVRKIQTDLALLPAVFCEDHFSLNWESPRTICQMIKAWSLSDILLVESSMLYLFKCS